MPDKFYERDISQNYLWIDTLRYTKSTWDTSGGVGHWMTEWVDSTEEAWQTEKKNVLQMAGYPAGNKAPLIICLIATTINIVSWVK
jgi:hypothetical protein